VVIAEAMEAQRFNLRGDHPGGFEAFKFKLLSLEIGL